jgi:hypothetical protein
MTGTRGEEDKEISRSLKSEPFEIEKKSVSAKARFALGEPATLTLTDGKKTVTASGASPRPAETKPLTKEDLYDRLSKMGATFLSLEKDNIEIDLEDGINLSPAEINALRREAAELLREQLSRKTGCLLPLVTAQDFQGGNAILLGMSDPDGSHLRQDYGSYSMSLYCKPYVNELRVIADSTANINMVARAVADTMLAGVPNKGTYDIILPEEPRIFAATTDAMHGLGLVSVSEPQTITDGLIYTKRAYKDRSGSPVIAYVLEADLSKVSLLNATPNYGNVIHNVKATTLEAMKSVAAAGYDVVAGVNADFFRINGDYSPQGLCIKQGRVLSGAEGRPWFGITKAGKAVMGDAAAYNKYTGQLQEAVGASTVLLKNGLVENVDYLSGSKTDRHPRTLVGTRADGTVLIIAIDGRQPAISNGASMSDLAWILLELGAVDAVNLDGGGSTTFITCHEAGKYNVLNSPSDGSLRPVYNSLVVVKKQ